jgi:hypothetical protein
MSDDWNGQPLAGDLLAVVIGGSATSPTLTVATPTGQLIVVPPSQIGDFLRGHRHVQLACFDVASLHRNLESWLRSVDDREAISVLWGYSRDGRLNDVQILDRLVRLAEQSDRHLPTRSLADLARDSFESSASSADLQAPQVILTVCENLLARAGHIAARLGIDQSLTERFGPLGHRIEVQGAIGFDRMRQHGLRTDPAKLDEAIRTCEERRDAAINGWREDPQFRRCLHFKDEKVVMKPDGFPRLRDKRFQDALAVIAAPLAGVHGVPLPVPFIGNERSAILRDWLRICPYHPFLRGWYEMMSACALRNTLVRAGNDLLQPAYHTWPRMHSVGPDLETVRRFDLFSVVRPERGKFHVALELHDIELVALASVLEQKHADASLANALRAANDPYMILASRLFDFDNHDLLRPNSRQPEKDTHWLNVARCLLHIVPRGVGIDGLLLSATQDFKLRLMRSEAKRFHDLTIETFPGLHDYLRDDTLERFAGNLHLSPDAVAGILQYTTDLGPSSWIKRTFFDRDEGIEIQHIQRELWQHTNECRQGSPTPTPAGLYEMLIAKDMVTPIGQVLGKASLWESLGAAHLHMADAIRKACVFAIAASGEQIVALAGNEIIVEMQRAESAIARLSGIASLYAKAVLVDIPVVCKHQWIAS